MANLNERAAQIMEHLCNHDWHGYSQGARWGDGEGTCTIWIDGDPYYVEQGDRDCSSAIISAYQAAGLDVDATYTGNMRSGFLATGLFSWEPMSFSASRGDIYLNEACHTAMCLDGGWEGVYGYDCLGEFSISETGGIYGEVGDQNSWESHICGYYDYPWDGILHYIGGDYDGGGSSSGGTGGLSIDEVAREVINGDWGNGDDRRNRLTAAGYNYDEVQARVNAILNGDYSVPSYSVDELAEQVINGDWGNGDDRRNRLTAAGYNYDEVQARVNEMLSSGPSYDVDAIANEVIMGYWGNGDDRVRRLTDAGYNYDEVQARVNEILS